MLKRNATNETTTEQSSTSSTSDTSTNTTLDKSHQVEDNHETNATTSSTVSTGTSTTTPQHSTTLQPCNDDMLMIHLADIQAINPESIINMATLDDLNELCKYVRISKYNTKT